MRNRSGFTFVEAILVIVITGILAGIAIPMLDVFGRNLAYITARQIVTDLRYTRTLAVTSGTRHYLRFFPAGGDVDGEYTSYAIYRDGVSDPIDNTAKSISVRVNCSSTPEEIGISYLGVRTTGDGLITLTDENQTYRVGFNAAVGRAYEY